MMQQRTRTRNPSTSPTAPASPAWTRAVKQLDFYYKADDDVVQKRSKWGGAMTIACAIVLVYLVLSEIITYASNQTEDILTVDTRRGEKLPINIDIKFPRLSCMDVTVDAVESTSGETLEEATHQIIKQRFNKQGKPFSEGVQKALGKDELKPVGARCLPCLPIDPPRALMRFARGRIDAETCCQTCADVREYLRTHALPQHLAEETAQCKVNAPYTDDEGCRIYGYLEVPRGKGDFHIAAGTGFSQKHEEHQHHIHQIDWSRIDKFNISHVVNKLSFGPAIPNVANPLDQHGITAYSLAQHIYMIQVIPTTYDNGNDMFHTNQYSFTQHHHHVQMGPAFVLPGVYFRYDINPLMIHIHSKDQSFANFLTRLCAIIGGLYVVFGIVYSLTGTVVKTTKKTKL